MICAPIETGQISDKTARPAAIAAQPALDFGDSPGYF
jgi:hypothetical protein